MAGAQEVDTIWRAVNPWGKYQFFQMVLVLVDYFPACFAILSAVFTGFIPDFTCEIPENPTTSSPGKDISYEAKSCTYDVMETIGNTTTNLGEQTCDKFVYADNKSYAYEWNLVCSRSNLAALAQSLALAGQGIGAMIMSHLADRYGRKTVHVISHICVMITMIIMAFSKNITMLLALRLVGGTFQQGIVCTGKILGLEMFPREVRSHTEAISFIAWSVGIMVLTLYGYVFRDINWRYLQIGLACFSFYSLFEWWILDESLRWLVSNGRIKEAKQVLRKAARWNNTDAKLAEQALDENTHLNDKVTVHADSSSTSESSLEMKTVPEMDVKQEDKPVIVPERQKVEKYTVIDILKNPSLRINTFILWYSWIVATGTYYGMTLVSSHLAGDRFINFFLSGVIEIPALLLEFYLFNKIGRKKTMILFFATAGLSLVVSTALLTVFAHITAVSTIAKVFSLIGKSASTGCFSAVFLYTPEIYPTNYRNSGLGIASSISRIGGILSPFASNLALIALWIPGAIFGGMCLLVVILAFRLPESAKHELPGTIAECDTWEKEDHRNVKDNL
ncbi:hypothetical protein ACF0H5_013038 [Mactra antiquata]